MREVVFESLGAELVGIIEYPDKLPAPAVILCHGLSNTKEDCPLIEQTSKMLVNNGFVTFRFDYFGSGESPGVMTDKTISILEQNTKDAINFASSLEEVTEIGMWGRSFGGTLVGLVAHDERICASAIASGVFYLVKVFDRDKVSQLAKKEYQMEERGQKLAGTGHYKGVYGLGEMWYKEVPHYFEILKKRLPLLSNVLVFGTSPDEKVPAENSMAIFDLVGTPKELHIFGNTNHAYAGVEKEVLRLTERWFKMYLGNYHDEREW